MHHPDDTTTPDDSPQYPLPYHEESLPTSSLDPWISIFNACPECCLPSGGYSHSVCQRS